LSFAEIVGVRQLDSLAIVWRCLHDHKFRRFIRTPTCDKRTVGRTDGRTDRHTATTNTCASYSVTLVKPHVQTSRIFGRPFVKRFALCYRTAFSCLPVCLSVCNVGVLWPNGWMDQDETWHAGRPRPWTHCVTWGPSSPSAKGHSLPQFSANVRCGQTAGWMKTPLGTEVDLGPGHIVLDGFPAVRERCTAAPHPSFRTMSIVATVAHLSYILLSSCLSCL